MEFCALHENKNGEDARGSGFVVHGLGVWEGWGFRIFHGKMLADLGKCFTIYGSCFRVLRV